MCALVPGILRKVKNKVEFGLKSVTWGSGTYCERKVMQLVRLQSPWGHSILLSNHYCKELLR